MHPSNTSRQIAINKQMAGDADISVGYEDKEQ
jgi:hypothetical protein